MKPVDVIEQLVGETKDWNQLETMVFVFFDCSKHNNNPCTVDFDKGLVTVQDQHGKALKQLAIKAELVEITE